MNLKKLEPFNLSVPRYESTKKCLRLRKVEVKSVFRPCKACYWYKGTYLFMHRRLKTTMNFNCTGTYKGNTVNVMTSNRPIAHNAQ